MKFGANQLRFEDLHYSLSDGYVATKLMCRLICNLPELSIRIFQSAYFLFFLLIGMNFGSQILILYAVG